MGAVVRAHIFRADPIVGRGFQNAGIVLHSNSENVRGRDPHHDLAEHRIRFDIRQVRRDLDPAGFPQFRKILFKNCLRTAR